MGQQKQRNRRWVLASRPHGAPVPENFRLEEDDVATPGEGQVLLRTVYLSLDPYMRGRMSDEPSYSPPVDIGGVMVGGTVSRVVESNHPDYQPGDWVLGYSGWQDYDISSGDDLVKLGDHPQNPSWSLGVLGMPGFTAYMGLLDIGQPKEGETLVVAAATGPVGATVGQIGKLKGCRVVGVAGGAENAAMLSRCWASMFVLITTRMILPNNWRKRAQKVLISIMKTWAVRYLMQCYHYLIHLRAFPFVA